MNTLEETQLLTVAEVARRLQQTERTVRDKIASGSLPPSRSAARRPVRVDRAELERWLTADPERRHDPQDCPRPPLVSDIEAVGALGREFRRELSGFPGRATTSTARARRPESRPRGGNG